MRTGKEDRGLIPDSQRVSFFIFPGSRTASQVSLSIHVVMIIENAFRMNFCDHGLSRCPVFAQPMIGPNAVQIEPNLVAEQDHGYQDDKSHEAGETILCLFRHCHEGSPRYFK